MQRSYLLDSNACINYLNLPDSVIAQRIRSVPVNQIVVCSVVKAELFYGSKHSRFPDANLAKQQKFFERFVSLPFDDESALVYGDVRSQLAKVGKPIGPYDLQIAAIALANDLVLVTHNIREFSRVTNLEVEDWEI